MKCKSRADRPAPAAIVWFVIAIAGAGCGSIGQNREYLLHYDGPEARPPYSLTDVYNLNRIGGSAEPIREGSPVNIIVNRAHIHDNSEDILEIVDQAEIGVVLSVDDGSEGGGKDFLVAFEHGIDDGADLPISDLLAYSTTNYQNQPIRVALTVFEFDQRENEMMRGVLELAATSAAAANPAYAPAASLASQLGSYLLTYNSDDIVTKMTFVLYPWPAGEPMSVSHHFGVPRIRYGQFAVLNSPVGDAKLVADAKTLHVDWNMQLSERSSGVDRPLPVNYVILTVDPSTALADAVQIIKRADSVARETAGLAGEGRIGVATPAGLTERVTSLGSAIRLFGSDREFEARKDAPDAMAILWNAYAATGPQGLGDNDKITLRDQIRRRLPTDVLQDPKCADPAADSFAGIFS